MYATNEIFENGILEITAEGITFGTDDSYTTDGETRTYFNEEQISNGGHTVTITGVNGIYTELRFHLQDKIIPQPGSYLITLKADADGVGSSKSISSGQSLTLISKETDSLEY